MRTALLRLMLAAPVALAQVRDAAPIRVDSCDLLRNLPAFNGKMVAATGIIQAPAGRGEGGSWLATPDCPVKIVVKGVEFGSTIEITPPWYPTIFLDHKVEFNWDSKSFGEVSELMHSINARTEDLHATVIGLFETRVPTESLVRLAPDRPEGIPMGYGHLNHSPAQIIVKTVTDIHVEKRRPPETTK